MKKVREFMTKPFNISKNFKKGLLGFIALGLLAPIPSLSNIDNYPQWLLMIQYALVAISSVPFIAFVHYLLQDKNRKALYQFYAFGVLATFVTIAFRVVTGWHLVIAIGLLINTVIQIEHLLNPLKERSDAIYETKEF